jgi:hypothetical protein
MVQTGRCSFIDTKGLPDTRTVALYASYRGVDQSGLRSSDGEVCWSEHFR